MAKKSKIESALEAKLAQVAAERDKLDAVADALRETLLQCQRDKSAPKRNRVSAVRAAVVDKFNETAKAATKPTV